MPTKGDEVMNHEEFQRAASYWTEREAEDKRMPEEDLRAEVDAFLGSHNTCALATGFDGFVRCTPLEYAWKEWAFWIFSEGGLKFRALEHNLNVSLAVFEPYAGFGSISSAQVTGRVEIVEPGSETFRRTAEARGITGKALETVGRSLHLLKVAPTRIDYLASDLKARGYSVRQWLEL